MNDLTTYNVTTYWGLEIEPDFSYAFDTVLTVLQAAMKWELLDQGDGSATFKVPDQPFLGDCGVFQIEMCGKQKTRVKFRCSDPPSKEDVQRYRDDNGYLDSQMQTQEVIHRLNAARETYWKILAWKVFDELEAGAGDGPKGKARKGGPLSTPDERKDAILKEWDEVAGNEIQSLFCKRKGIGVSTLGAWLRERKAQS